MDRDSSNARIPMKESHVEGDHYPALLESGTEHIYDQAPFLDSSLLPLLQDFKKFCQSVVAKDPAQLDKLKVLRGDPKKLVGYAVRWRCSDKAQRWSKKTGYVLARLPLSFRRNHPLKPDTEVLDLTQEDDQTVKSSGLRLLKRPLMNGNNSDVIDVTEEEGRSRTSRKECTINEPEEHRLRLDLLYRAKFLDGILNRTKDNSVLYPAGSELEESRVALSKQSTPLPGYGAFGFSQGPVPAIDVPMAFPIIHAPQIRVRKEEYKEDQPGCVTLALVSTTHFTAKVRKPVHPIVMTYIKLTEGAKYDSTRKIWLFPLASHDMLLSGLSHHVGVVGIPRSAMGAAMLASSEVPIGDSENFAILEGKIPKHLLKVLAPFQKEGVCYVLSKGGRALIGDEMGLGKTIQAIACAAAYRNEWPLFIVSPSTARFHWQYELCHWLGSNIIKKEEIYVVCQAKRPIPANASVVITSYDLLNRLKNSFNSMNFGVVIADESHYLKNMSTVRTKALLPIAHKAKRVILLSGTPALSRPMELYTQLHILQPEVWNVQHDFGIRYCAAKKGRFGWNYSGASNLPELHTLLRGTVMIRRLKKDMLKNLPPKQRCIVEVVIEDEAFMENMKERLAALAMRDTRIGNLQKVHFAAAGIQIKQKDEKDSLLSNKEEEKETCGLLMALFADTGTCKIPAILRHLEVILDDRLSGKTLVFAHHKNVLDALENCLRNNGKTKYIRIDGRTKAKDRHEMVQLFQSNPHVRIALLGLTAAGVGITLTAASRVVFAELFWTPAQLLQAEDRCHRIGQTSTVKIQYLVAQNTLDNCLWALIKQKIALLGEMVEGEGGHKMEAKRVTACELATMSKQRAEALEEAAQQVSKPKPPMDSIDISNNSKDALSTGQSMWDLIQSSITAVSNELAIEDINKELKKSGSYSDIDLDEWGVRSECSDSAGADSSLDFGDLDPGKEANYADNATVNLVNRFQPLHIPNGRTDTLIPINNISLNSGNRFPKYYYRNGVDLPHAQQISRQNYQNYPCVTDQMGYNSPRQLHADNDLIYNILGQVKDREVRHFTDKSTREGAYLNQFSSATSRYQQNQNFLAQGIGNRDFFINSVNASVPSTNQINNSIQVGANIRNGNILLQSDSFMKAQSIIVPTAQASSQDLCKVGEKVVFQSPPYYATYSSQNLSHRKDPGPSYK